MHGPMEYISYQTTMIPKLPPAEDVNIEEKMEKGQNLMLPC